MRWLMALANYLWHPLFVPMYGWFLVTYVQPYRFDTRFMLIQGLILFIVLVLSPLILFPVLRQLKVVDSIDLKTAKQRKWPLMIQCLLWVIALKILGQTSGVTPLYYFYLGALVSTVLALLASMRSYKASLHQMGITGLAVFAFGLSWHMDLRILTPLLILSVAVGWVASARLWSKAHSSQELWLGGFFGAFPQVVLFFYWL